MSKVSQERKTAPIIEIPSKWDIIPIHASDVSAFKFCRRKWDWSSPTRTNLRRRVDLNGVYFPLWFGSGIHYALEQFYHPALQRDPVEAFRTWYNYQWEGGIVTEDWLERLYDNDPQPASHPNGPAATNTDPETSALYKVRGLKSIHPDPVKEEFEFHLDLGIGMMTFYKEYAAANDHFVVVAPESKFSVPLGFEAIDRRKDSPNYGKSLEVHARGTRDAILYNPDTERFGLLENKTAASIEAEYFTKLEMDEQVNTYFWASQHEAEVYDLPYKRIDRVIYNVMRKAYPKPPTILSDGISPSINRKEESTTAEMFAAHIAEQGIQALYDDNPKWQAYYDYLVKAGDEQFIVRKPIMRNQHQIAASFKHYQMVAQEMLDTNLRIYPTPSSSWLCQNCQFRAPCLAADDGSDFIYMLSTGYEENRGR